MSSHDDDIRFDFFDEPETVEAARGGRRAPAREGGGGPPRRPLRTPTGVVPLVRLIGLIAIAIAIVVALVFWVGACQGKSRHDEYASYAAAVRTIAQSSTQLGSELATKLLAPALKQTDLETSLQQYAQQEQQAYTQAQQIRPPGPLRQIHGQLIDALELRAKGLSALGDALTRTASSKDASTAAQTLAQQAELLVASDVVWEQLYRQPATQRLKEAGVTGVVIPASTFVSNVDLVGARSFSILYQRLHGASTGGTPTGKHGNQIVSVKVLPKGTTLSPTTATTVSVSADLAFAVTVQNSGDFQEVNVPVTLTISAGGPPIVRRQAIQVIQPAEQRTLTFGSFNLPTSAFGAKATVKADIGAVAGEINTANNTATYTVFFTLSGP